MLLVKYEARGTGLRGKIYLVISLSLSITHFGEYQVSSGDIKYPSKLARVKIKGHGNYNIVTKSST